MPRYEHDCDQCVFLGEYDKYDLYHCSQGNTIDTVIARYGNDGPDYSSGLAGAYAGIEHLAEALRLAKAQGFIPRDH